MERTGAETLVARGRYVAYFRAGPCGEERWEIVRGPQSVTATGEQELVAPYPIPHRQEYRVTLTHGWRPTGLEIRWTVGGHVLEAVHRAEGGMWRVRIDYQGQVKRQEGNFPEVCEVDYGTHLFSSFILARRDFAVGGEHEFPALRIGPPFMAVTPERMLYRCLEAGIVETPLGRRPAKRYLVSLPPRPESEGYGFWADEEGWVLESHEGPEPGRTWMKLVELETP